MIHWSDIVQADTIAGVVVEVVTGIFLDMDDSERNRNERNYNHPSGRHT